jgi:hypothetical protein
MAATAVTAIPRRRRCSGSGLPPAVRLLEGPPRGLPSWLHHCNWHRPHGSLHGSPPMGRLVAADNLVRLHT